MRLKNGPNAESPRRTLISPNPRFDIMRNHILKIVRDKESAREYCSRGNVIGIEEIYPRVITKELLTSKKHYNRLLNKMSEGIPGIEFGT